MSAPEFDASYHARECTHALRNELLGVYIRHGIAGVRGRLDGMCPGCVTDLVVGYVVSDGDAALDDEFAAD